VISRNIEEMQAHGHPHRVAVAAALREAGVPKKKRRRRHTAESIRAHH